MLALSIVMVASVVATSAPPTSSPTILITEIMFDPLSPERRGESEWVEIANVGALPVDLRGWRLDDEDTRASSEWGPFDVVLHPGAVAILVNEAAVTVEEFRAAWPSTGAAPPPILAPILPSPPPPDPAADRDADPAAGRDPEVGVRDGRRPNDDARGADHGRPGGGARSAASVAMVHIIPVRWGGLSNAPSATNEILRLRDEHDDIACEVNFACGESWPPCRSGFSLELIDAGGADPASGASWRRAAAGKHGATTSRAAGVFIGADVGSPGVVSGLTDIVFFGAPPPAGAGPPDHTPPNRAADPDRRRQFDDTIDFARRAGPSSSDSRPSDEPRRVVDASSPDRLHGAPDAMNYRRLGMWGIKLSEIGFGSWLNFNDSDQPHADALHRAAYETGINFFDTANAYGGQTTEVVVGRALAPFRRDTIVLATKLYWPLKDWPFPGANDRGLSRKHIFEQCDASLKRLGTDYIDLYQCHRYDDETPLVETCRAMNDLIAHGKVLYWGVSEWTVEQINEAIELCERQGWHRPASNQPLYNMLERHWEAEVFPACRRHGMGIINFSPLAEGLLTGKYLDGVPAGSRAADENLGKFIANRMTDENLSTIRRLKAVADELGAPMARMALAWCLRRPEVTSTIAGASRPEQITENALAADLYLDDAVMARINSILGG